MPPEVNVKVGILLCTSLRLPWRLLLVTRDSCFSNFTGNQFVVLSSVSAIRERSADFVRRVHTTNELPVLFAGS
jgi:hypothetical protein